MRKAVLALAICLAAVTLALFASGAGLPFAGSDKPAEAHSGAEQVRVKSTCDTVVACPRFDYVKVEGYNQNGKWAVWTWGKIGGSKRATDVTTSNWWWKIEKGVKITIHFRDFPFLEGTARCTITKKDHPSWQWWNKTVVVKARSKLIGVPRLATTCGI